MFLLKIRSLFLVGFFLVIPTGAFAQSLAGQGAINGTVIDACREGALAGISGARVMRPDILFTG